MALSRTERFKLKSRIIDEMNADNSGWDIRRQNLLLAEFDLETLGEGNCWARSPTGPVRPGWLEPPARGWVCPLPLASLP